MTVSAIGVEEYLDFVDREYLTGYISGGGAAVKLLCSSDDTARARLAAGLQALEEA